jgi:hypothetical protein
MRPRHRPSELSPEQRLRELATIFAAGLIRWRKQQHRLAQTGTSPNSVAPGLEVPPDTVLSVINPVNGPENPKPGALA